MHRDLGDRHIQYIFSQSLRFNGKLDGVSVYQFLLNLFISLNKFELISI